MIMSRVQLNNSCVIFEPVAHEYWLDGKLLSGITGMLQRQLFPNEFDNIPRYIIDAAADYGTCVHSSVEQFDANFTNDGTQEVADYIDICKSYGLVHEASEYLVSDGKHWASQIDKVYRVADDTFSIGDIKTYGAMTSEKLAKTRWQLSIYAYFFELQNRKAKVDKLFIIRLRNKMKKDGTFDHVKEIVFVDRIPVDICKELLDCDLAGNQFQNPFAIPAEYKSQEQHIVELIQLKNRVEEELTEIKSKVLMDMNMLGVKSWIGDMVKFTRKAPATRTSLNVAQLKAEHPEIDYSAYEKTSHIAGSLQIVI